MLLACKNVYKHNIYIFARIIIPFRQDGLVMGHQIKAL